MFPKLQMKLSSTPGLGQVFLHFSGQVKACSIVIETIHFRTNARLSIVPL
jgi:hypothetical protein